MKKFLVLACIVSLFFVPAAFAAETVTITIPTTPGVTGGVVSGDLSALSNYGMEEIMNLLGSEGFSQTYAEGGNIIIQLSEGSSGINIAITYPSGGTIQTLLVFDNAQGKWVAVENSSSGNLEAAAAPESLAVTDNGAYDQDPTAGVVLASYAACTQVVGSGGGGGCALGSVGGLAAVILLLGPALFIFRRK